MQITIKTDELKGAINKVVKGLGNNKLLPITEMLGLNFVDKNLFLVSTDGSTKVQVKLELQDKVDDFSFVVNGKSFTQLVSKTTTENITLNAEKDKLVVKGNGSYTFSFPTDEDGNLVIMNNIDTSNYENTEEVSAKEVLKSYEINKSSVAETMETPEYTGFYFDEEGALTTNSLKISYFSNKVFTSKLLLAGKFLSLFSLFTEDNVKIYQSNAEIVAETKNVSIQGYKMTEVTEFPISDIKPFLENDLPHKVRLNKKALLNLLERISVFVTPFDKNSIKIDFTKDGLKVWTLDGVNNELIPYTDSENVKEETIKVDVVNFKDLVGSNPDDELVIMYGNPSAIKMTFDDVSQVLALVGE